MKTITFDIEKAIAVENAVSEIFGCQISEIVSLKDTLFKKVVVYILSITENYNPHVLASNYQISYLYIPTVIKELEYMKEVVPGFHQNLEKVYEKMDGCGKAIA